MFKAPQGAPVYTQAACDRGAASYGKPSIADFAPAKPRIDGINYDHADESDVGRILAC